MNAFVVAVVGLLRWRRIESIWFLYAYPTSCRLDDDVPVHEFIFYLLSVNTSFIGIDIHS
jgi:hypothetical protein